MGQTLMDYIFFLNADFEPVPKKDAVLARVQIGDESLFVDVPRMATDAAANQATESELRSVIKYPPEKGNGTRAINVAMENGGAGKTLKSAPEAKRFVVTGRTDDSAEFKESDHPRGQPGNAGQFGSGGGGGGGEQKESKLENPYKDDPERAQLWEQGFQVAKSGKKPRGAFKQSFWKGYEAATGGAPAEQKPVAPPSTKQQQTVPTEVVQTTHANTATRKTDARDIFAFREYTGQNFRYANAIARGQENELGRPQREIGKKLMAEMDRAWETVPPITENETVYRGMHRLQDVGIDPNNLDAVIGKSISNQGWTSTSSDVGIAQTFASGSLRGAPNYTNGAVFKMNVPVGTRVLDVQKTLGGGSFGNEREKVLPRGGKFIVTGVKKGNPSVIDVSYSPGGTAHDQAFDWSVRQLVHDSFAADVIVEDFSLTDAATAALQSAIAQITHVSNPHIDDQIDYIVNNFAAISGYTKSRARELLSSAISRRKHANDMATDVAIILDSYAILCAYRSR